MPSYGVDVHFFIVMLVLQIRLQKVPNIETRSETPTMAPTAPMTPRLQDIIREDVYYTRVKGFDQKFSIGGVLRTRPKFGH